MRCKHVFIALGLACCLVAGGASADQQRISTRELGKQAQKGEVACMVQYGDRLLDGDEIKVDAIKGAEYYRSARDKGDPAGAYGLANCLFYGWSDLDLAGAFSLYKLAATQGYSTANGPLGRCYDYGFGTRSCYEDGLRFYLSAANNDLEAQAAVCGMFSTDRNPLGDVRAVGQNVNQLLGMCQQAEFIELTPVLYEMMVRDRQFDPVVQALLARAAKVNMKKVSARQQYYWGRVYQLASESQIADTLAQAKDCYTRSAASGFLFAKLALAELQLKGGDKDGAVSAYRVLADNHSFDAKLTLFNIYEADALQDSQSFKDFMDMGQDLQRAGWNGAVSRMAALVSARGDDAQAWSLWRLSADLGEAVGCYKTAEFYRTGVGDIPSAKTSVDMKKAYGYLSTLCQKLPRTDYRQLDMCHAYTVMGNMCLYGKGCDINTEAAEEWYNKACQVARGDKTEAKFRLAQICLKSPSRGQEGIDILRQLRDNPEAGEFARSAKYLLQKRGVK